MIYAAVAIGCLLAGGVIGFFVGLRVADNAMMNSFRW